ncbi:MAG: hypothetical protein WCS42_13420 [Verrucomicrobiota bacterium]
MNHRADVGDGINHGDNAKENQPDPSGLTPAKPGLFIFGFIHTVSNLRVSVRGFGENTLARFASTGTERSVNNSFSKSCWSRNDVIISVVGTDLEMTICAPSRCETLTMKSKTQTAASPVQIRRHGQINSSQTLLEQPRNGATKETGQLCSFVPLMFNPATTSRRIASSFGAAA